ncbi:MAG: hypothetical protein AB8F74_20760, partial [Saprospiraceae bacterium]
SEDLEIREPEDGNDLWAKFVDGQRLELIGTPDLLADGTVEAKGDVIAGYNRTMRAGSTTNNVHLAGTQWGNFATYVGGHLMFRSAVNTYPPTPPHLVQLTPPDYLC